MSPLSPRRTAILTYAEARELARHLLAKNPDDPLRNLITQLTHDWLMLTGDQLRRWCQVHGQDLSKDWHSFERTLSKYCKWQILRALPDVSDRLQADGLHPLWPFAPQLQKRHGVERKAGDIARASDFRLRAYQLGPVGEALMIELYQKIPNPAKGADQVHNLLCAEVCLRLVEANPATKARGPRELMVREKRETQGRARQQTVVEPDASLRHQPADALAQVWLMEFMNERSGDGDRIKDKFAGYAKVLSDADGDAQAHNPARWRTLWKSDAKPIMLFVYRTPSVLKALQQRASLTRDFSSSGLLLADALDGFPLNWHGLMNARREPDPAQAQRTRAPAAIPEPPRKPLPPRARRKLERERAAQRLAPPMVPSVVDTPPPTAPAPVTASPMPPPLPTLPPLTTEYVQGREAVQAVLRYGAHGPEAVIQWLNGRGVFMPDVLINTSPLGGFGFEIEKRKYVLVNQEAEIRVWSLSQPERGRVWLRVERDEHLSQWIANETWRPALALWLKAVVSGYDWPEAREVPVAVASSPIVAPLAKPSPPLKVASPAPEPLKNAPIPASPSVRPTPISTTPLMRATPAPEKPNSTPTRASSSARPALSPTAPPLPSTPMPEKPQPAPVVSSPPPTLATPAPRPTPPQKPAPTTAAPPPELIEESMQMVLDVVFGQRALWKAHEKAVAREFQAYRQELTAQGRVITLDARTFDELRARFIRTGLLEPPKKKRWPFG